MTELLTSDLLERPPHGPAQFEHPRTPELNISRRERWLSMAGGAALIGLSLARLLGLRPHWISGIAAGATGAALLNRGISGHCPLYGSFGISTAEDFPMEREVTIQKTITVRQTPETLYAFWRHLEVLPGVLSHVDHVEVIDEWRSFWVTSLPFGQKVSWEAEIVADIPGDLIAWRSLPGSPIEQYGSIRFEFAPARGTEVRLELTFVPPGGALGIAVAKLLDDLGARLLRDDLRRFKRLMETGEIPTTHGQPIGASRRHAPLVEVAP